MPFCPNCGAAAEGRFCPQCGTAIGSAAPSGPGGGASISPPTVGSAALADNVAGAICYLGLLITGILFLVLAPYNKNRAVRFHAMQAIFLNVAWILMWFVFNVVLGAIHFIGLAFGLFLSPLLWLAFVVLWIYMIVTTYQGKTVVLPVIGPLAQQQA